MGVYSGLEGIFWASPLHTWVYSGLAHFIPGGVICPSPDYTRVYSSGGIFWAATPVIAGCPGGLRRLWLPVLGVFYYVICRSSMEFCVYSFWQNVHQCTPTSSSDRNPTWEVHLAVIFHTHPFGRFHCIRFSPSTSRLYKTVRLLRFQPDQLLCDQYIYYGSTWPTLKV